MELAERVEQLEQQVKTFRPELHFPVTATLEHRLRWLEIVFEEMKARDNHGAPAETSLGEKLEKILGNTIYIRPDRITLHSLTADPASVVAGDLWFRSDFGKTKQAIDSVVANARLLRREGDIVPAAEIEDLDTAKVTTGRFPMTRIPDGTAGYFLKAQGVGANPVYAAVSAASIASGSYSGNNATNRAITHGLGLTPKIVFIIHYYNTLYDCWFRIYGGLGMIAFLWVGSALERGSYSVTAPNTTSFYVGNGSDYARSGNGSGIPYYWVAMG